MNIHKNARLTPIRRAELVRSVLNDGMSFTAVATTFGVAAAAIAMADMNAWAQRS